MKAAYLVMLDSEKSGRVLCIDNSALGRFDTPAELNALMLKNGGAAQSSAACSWDPLSVVPGKLATLQVTVMSIDDAGLHGFIRNGKENDCFADTESFNELMQNRVRAVITRRRCLEASRLSMRRARRAGI